MKSNTIAMAFAIHRAHDYSSLFTRKQPLQQNLGYGLPDYGTQ